MNFPGNFITHGKVDVSELQRQIGKLTNEQWNTLSNFQQSVEAHEDTQMFPLVFDPDYRHTHPTRMPALETFQGALRPALELVSSRYEESQYGQHHVQQYGEGSFIRAMLVKLKAGGTIAPHCDKNFSLAHSHRIHIPIFSNPHVLFTVGKETICMLEGDVVEINNRREHSVENRSKTDRTHLILDYVLPGEQCCCGRKLHPDTVCSPSACMQTDLLNIPCVCHPEA